MKSPAFFRQGIGAVDETRTRDLHLGKVALYQLSYYRTSTAGGELQRESLVRAKRLELIRLWHQILNLARLPFRHARTLHTTRMALRLPTPKSGRLFIILYAPSLVKAETAIFFCIAIAVVHRPRGNRKQAMAEGSAPFVHPLEGKKGESLPRERRGISRAWD